MISDNDNKIEIEKESENNYKNEKDYYLNELENKYNNLKNNNSQNNFNKEINCLKNILENSFAINEFNNYINKDFLDNCEYKLVFMPDEFHMKEENKFYFSGFGEKRKKRGNFRNKNNTNNKNYAITEAKKNKRKME